MRQWSRVYQLIKQACTTTEPVTIGHTGDSGTGTGTPQRDGRVDGGMEGAKK